MRKLEERIEAVEDEIKNINSVFEVINKKMPYSK